MHRLYKICCLGELVASGVDDGVAPRWVAYACQVLAAGRLNVVLCSPDVHGGQVNVDLGSLPLKVQVQACRLGCLMQSASRANEYGALELSPFAHMHEVRCGEQSARRKCHNDVKGPLGLDVSVQLGE